MKQTLPWNVTGIPPEAREAARAAASREGMSVGDWLTRRIFAESSQPGLAARSEYSPYDYEFGRESGPQREREAPRRKDKRGEREDFVYRLARNEDESDSAFRRIDDTLHALGGRLETAERSQNETRRALAVTVEKVKAAASEHTQVASQLTQRIDEVQRQSDTSMMREAVRGLHQGLSRLADQMARMTTESGGRIDALAGNLETLSGSLDTLSGNFDALSGNFDALSGSLETVSGKVDAVREESQRRIKELDKRGGDVSDRLKRAEERLDSAGDGGREEFNRRIAAIEGGIGQISGRVEQVEHKLGTTSDEPLKEALRRLGDRVDAAEKRNREALAELRAGLPEIERRIDSLELSAPEPASADAGKAAGVAAAAAPAAVAAADTHADAAPDAGAGTGSNVQSDAPEEDPAEADELPPPADFDLPPFPEAPPPAEGEAATSPSDEPPPFEEEELPPVAEDAGIPPGPDAKRPNIRAASEDYLSAARRAAQEAADTDSARKGPARMLNRGGDAETSWLHGRLPMLAAAAIVILAIGIGGYLVTGGFNPVAPGFIGNRFTAVEDSLFPDPNDLTVLPPVLGPDSFPEPGAPGGALSGPAGQGNAGRALILAPEQPASATPPSVPAAPQQAVTASGPTLAAPQAAGTGASPLERLMSQARAGSPAAALVLGLKYLDGDGVAASDSEAVRWLRRAAEQGEPVAQYRLGGLYERGRGIPADPGQASFWYEQAAMGGNRRAMHNLAVAYADGSGVERNLGEAMRWFREAAELGLGDSQFNLGVLYERGMGAEASLPEAYKWYFIASRQGDMEAEARVEALATQISAEQRLTAERAGNAYAPRPLDQAANEPPTLAQLAP